MLDFFYLLMKVLANLVLRAGWKNPRDTLAVTKRCVVLLFSCTPFTGGVVIIGENE